MGFIFGLIGKLIRWSLYFLVFAAVIVLIPNLPPYTKFSSFELEPPLPRTGPLAPNEALNKAEKLYTGKLLSPEAFQLFNGEVYTTLATGEIVKVSPGGHVTFVTKIGEPCTSLSKEHICGRPLGFEIDEKNRLLYVADAYYGIWKVDLKTDRKKLLVSPRVEIGGRAPKLFNSLTLGKNGDLYWTDSSSDFLLKDGAMSILTDPSGRLFHYDAAKNQSRVLLDNLWFPNGVIMSHDKQFVLVGETGRFRVMKYYIDGPKKGRSEVFVAGLPGIPDNLRALPDGSGLLVALYTVYDAEHPLISRSMAQTPVVRKFLARVQRLVEIPFEFLNEQYPTAVFDDIVYNIGSFKSLSGFLPGMSGLVQLDWNGNIIASYFNTDGSLNAISDCIVVNDKLYLGSPHGQDFIGVVPAPALLKKAFASAKPAETKKEAPKAQEKPKEAPKVAKPAQEPHKTTPPPPKTTTPPPKTTTPPPKTTTPPPKTTTPPPKTTTPPPKTTTPPPKTTTPPPKTTTPPPKTTPPPRQAEPVKVATPKPTTAKPAEPKPTPAAKPTQPPKQEKPTAKPEQKTPPKPAEPKPKPAEKPVKPEEPKVKTDGAKTVKNGKPEQIPIVEEIPSDTVKPNQDKLKVIKKDGPTEIPNYT